MFCRLPLAAALAAGSIFFAAPAVAGSAAEDVIFGDHPEYSACEKNEDCAVVKGLCEEWRAVNKRNQQKLADAVNYLSVAFVCKDYSPYQDQPSASCSYDRKCQLGK